MENFLTEQEAKSVDQPLEFRIALHGKSEYIFHDRQLEKLKPLSDSFYTLNQVKTSVFIRTTPGRVFFRSKFPL